MIFALNFGLFNEFGEYLVTVGHSVAFLFPLLLKFGTAESSRSDSTALLLLCYNSLFSVWRFESLENIGVQTAKPRGFAKETWFRFLRFQMSLF